MTLSPQDIFKLVSPSIFTVESLDANGVVIMIGSAVGISQNAVVTNDHVIAGGTKWRVRQGWKSWPAEVTNDDASHDICRLKVSGLEVHAVYLRNSADINIGEHVYAIGSPAGLEFSLSDGIVSGIRHLHTGEMIQMTAAISKGSSGGGLFDSSGRLVGITTSYIESGQNLNFALPADLVSTLDSHPIEGASLVHNQHHWFEAETYIAEGWEFLRKLTADGPDDNTAGEAYAAFFRAIELEPTMPEPYMGIGKIDEVLGETKSAVKAYKNASERDPRNALTWYLLGLQYERLDRHDEAIASLKTAVALKPDYCDAWGMLGSIDEVEQKNRLEATEVYTKVKELAAVQGPSCQKYEQTLRAIRAGVKE